MGRGRERRESSAAMNIICAGFTTYTVVFTERGGNAIMHMFDNIS